MFSTDEIDHYRTRQDPMLRAMKTPRQFILEMQRIRVN